MLFWHLLYLDSINWSGGFVNCITINTMDMFLLLGEPYANYLCGALKDVGEINFY